jgi:hypothetical protein
VSAVIVDGPLTETVACTGNATGTTDGSTIACAATANAHSANVYVYFQLTASIGPTAYLRCTKIDFSDMYAQLYDKGYRGSQAFEYGAQQGMRNSDFTLDGDLFADEFGYILGSFFGAYDYTGTSGGNPTTYAFSPQNTGTGQPTPYLFYDYNPGANQTYVVAKAVIGDLTIKFDPAALTQWTAVGKGFAIGPVATPTQSFSNFTPVAARVGGTTIGGTITPDLATAEFSFKREEFGEVNTIQGIQDPLAIFSGPVSLAAKFSIVQADATQDLNYVNGSQPSFDVKAVKGLTTAQNGVQVHCSSANYDSVKIVQTGKSYVVLDGGFHGLATTADASTAGGGYSPSKITLSVGTNTGATLY